MSAFNVGEFVTVTRGKQLADSRYDSSYAGAVLQVLASSGPFLLVQEVRSKYGLPSTSRIALHMGDWAIERLDPEYVEAMTREVSK